MHTQLHLLKLVEHTPSDVCFLVIVYKDRNCPYPLSCSPELKNKR